MSLAFRQLPGGPFRHGDISVRRWQPEDAEALNDAVAVSREHLLAWMPWASEPDQTPGQRLERFAEWEREWHEGGDCVYGIFENGAVAGGCGLHRRLGTDGLEIGYWLHTEFTGRGVMTVAARLLTDAAFTVPEVEIVEIHHDRANVASAGVPARLGYTLVEEVARPTQAPGDEGVECRWRMTRASWPAARRL